MHEGEITSFDLTNNLYKAKFQDRDREEFIHDEIGKHRKKQYSTRRKKIKPTTCRPPRQISKSVTFISTKANPNPIKKDYMQKHRTCLLYQQHKEYYILAHSALAGAIWDDEIKKLALYNCNKTIKSRLTKGGKNEFGRLFQGFSPNDIDGLDVLE